MMRLNSFALGLHSHIVLWFYRTLSPEFDVWDFKCGSKVFDPHISRHTWFFNILFEHHRVSILTHFINCYTKISRKVEMFLRVGKNSLCAVCQHVTAGSQSYLRFPSHQNICRCAYRVFLRPQLNGVNWKWPAATAWSRGAGNDEGQNQGDNHTCNYGQWPLWRWALISYVILCTETCTESRTEINYVSRQMSPYDFKMSAKLKTRDNT